MVIYPTDVHSYMREYESLWSTKTEHPLKEGKIE